MSSDITVVIAGSERAVATGTTAAELLAEDKGALVARVNGELRDLAHVVADGDVVEAVGLDSDEGLAVLRHSAAHVLAQAVQQINPKARLGIGPPIRDGFYYDFDVETPFTHRRPQGPREGHAEDHQRGADLPAPGGHR